MPNALGRNQGKLDVDPFIKPRSIYCVDKGLNVGSTEWHMLRVKERSSLIFGHVSQILKWGEIDRNKGVRKEKGNK